MWETQKRNSELVVGCCGGCYWLWGVLCSPNMCPIVCTVSTNWWSWKTLENHHFAEICPIASSCSWWYLSRCHIFSWLASFNIVINMVHVSPHDPLDITGSAVCICPHSAAFVSGAATWNRSIIFIIEDHNYHIVRVRRCYFSYCYVGCDLIVFM